MTQPKHGNKEQTCISHHGAQFKTTHYIPIPDEKCQEIKEEFFRLPSEKETYNELYNVHHGYTKIGNITDFYFSEYIYQTKLYSSKWSIKEFFESNDLIRFAYAKVQNNPEFYDDSSLIRNIRTVFRLSPSGTAAKVSNYPLKSVKQILKKYQKESAWGYYDYSCGWGVRLLGALAQGVKYSGTDPNTPLCKNLERMARDYNKVNNINNQYQIYNQGSEILIPELVDNIGIAFSSPPYFNLEDYREGEQSIKDRNYEQWLEQYWRGTVQNIMLYLKSSGVMLLNIKSFKKYDLLNDMKDICIEEGLVYKESLELKNIQRIQLMNHDVSSDEQILVFRKPGYVEPSVDSLEDW